MLTIVINCLIYWYQWHLSSQYFLWKMNNVLSLLSFYDQIFLLIQWEFQVQIHEIKTFLNPTKELQLEHFVIILSLWVNLLLGKNGWETKVTLIALNLFSFTMWRIFLTKYDRVFASIYIFYEKMFNNGLRKIFVIICATGNVNRERWYVKSRV